MCPHTGCGRSGLPPASPAEYQSSLITSMIPSCGARRSDSSIRPARTRLKVPGVRSGSTAVAADVKRHRASRGCLVGATGHAPCASVKVAQQADCVFGPSAGRRSRYRVRARFGGNPTPRP